MKRNHEDIRVDLVRQGTRDTAPWAPGSPKRFISEVYDQLEADGRTDGVTLAEFKDILLELHRRGDIVLARADLVAAMPYDTVRESEIDAGGATYHFIVGDTANPFDDFERRYAEKMRLRELDIDAIETLLEQSPALRGTSGGTHAYPIMAIVSGETADRDQGSLRVTFFKDDGPLGHATRKTMREIATEVREMVYPPYESMTDSDVLAWTSTEKYEIGSRQVAYVQAINTLSWHASKLGRRDLFERAEKAAEQELRGEQGTSRPGVHAWDRALKILHTAIRELPNANPHGLRNLMRNPAWVTSALADHYEILDDQVPPRWMPLLAGVTNDRKKLVADLVEYGCGAYGCVIATNDPRTVLKVTTDDTEAEFAAQLAPTLVAPICVTYELVVRLSARHKGNPVHLLWREAADQVGRIETALEEPYGERAVDLIRQQHRAAQMTYAAIVEGFDRDVIERGIQLWLEAVERMGRIAELRPLARGIERVWNEQRIFFGDIHEGNLGLVKRASGTAWVITDPGHVAVIED